MTWVGELATKLAGEGKANEIERELEKIDPATLADAEREEWWHIYGITAFQAGHETVALERFRQGYREFPGSALMRFSLGQQYVRVNEPEKGFTLFRGALFPEIPERHALVEVRYVYLFGRYEDGRTFIRPFFDAYKKLKVLDDNFLYVRGLPFFGTYWHHLAAFSVLSGGWVELDDVVEYASKNCSDYDFDGLRVELDAYRDGNPTRLLPSLKYDLEKFGDRSEYSTGFTRMIVAVIDSRGAPTIASARSSLESVILTRNDFPWLQDVKALAISEAAHRLGDAQVEARYVSAFLQRQPLLFEPDIALTFWLLGTQERLKPALIESFSRNEK